MMSDQQDEISLKTQQLFKEWHNVAHKFTCRSMCFFKFAQASVELLGELQALGLLPQDQTIKVGLSLAENSAMVLGYQKTHNNGRSFNSDGTRHIEKILLFGEPTSGSFQNALEEQFRVAFEFAPFDSLQRSQLIHNRINEYRTSVLGFHP